MKMLEKNNLIIMNKFFQIQFNLKFSHILAINSISFTVYTLWKEMNDFETLKINLQKKNKEIYLE